MSTRATGRPDRSGGTARTGHLPEWLQEDRSDWADKFQDRQGAAATFFVDTAADAGRRHTLAVALHDAVAAAFPELAGPTAASVKQSTIGMPRHPDGRLGRVKPASWRDGLDLANNYLTHSWSLRGRRRPGVNEVTIHYQAVMYTEPGTYLFWINVSLGLDETDLDGIAARLTRAALTFARVADPTYGELGADTARSLQPETVLDQALGRSESDSANASRQYLRGYGWITICPPEIADRLGGANALLSSGAFHTVHRLPAGGLWLQATEHVSHYTPAHAEVVFDALRPVLPPGQPDESRSIDLRRIVMEDAQPSTPP